MRIIPGLRPIVDIPGRIRAEENHMRQFVSHAAMPDYLVRVMLNVNQLAFMAGCGLPFLTH